MKNGFAYLPNDKVFFDIAIKDEKISLIGKKLKVEANEIVDATGKIVLPGAIDAHVHLAMLFGGTVSSDDYYSGTRAAVCLQQ